MKRLRKPNRTVPVLADFRWRPVYDRVIMLHCLGKSKEEISVETKQQIRMINRVIRSAEGQRLMLTYREKSNKVFTEANHDRMLSLQETALKNVESVLTNEELLKSNPLAVFDRSMKFLDSQRPIPVQPTSPGTQIVQNNLINVPTQLIDRVASALNVLGELHGREELRVLADPGTKKEGSR